MRNAPAIDAATLSTLLNELRLPAIKVLWPDFAERADKEGWPAARFLSVIAEHELAERDRRRIERHLAEARLPPGKTLDSFAFDAVPMVSKAQVMAIAAGDSWLAKGANILLFGPPGGGKSHLAAAIGLALIENGWRVLFMRTTELVQKLQVARRELQLESAIAKLDKFDLLILDDLAYVTKDQAETSVLFELISARYERRSIMITANQPFGEWNRVFPDPAMTLAAVDRLVHHATIFEMNVESYRRRSAMEAKRQRGRPASFATIRNAAEIDAARQSETNEALASDNHDDTVADNRPLPATITMIPSPTTATPESHPDCRADLSQIVALQPSHLITLAIYASSVSIRVCQTEDSIMQRQRERYRLGCAPTMPRQHAQSCWPGPPRPAGPVYA
ncbi:DNA replication protein DnaC [Sinorhizobium fredii]